MWHQVLFLGFASQAETHL